MKKTLLILITIFLASNSYSQGYIGQRNIVFNGISFENEPSPLPYTFMDLLRLETEGWTVEKSIQGQWSFEEKQISTKNKDGKFKELRTLVWDGSKWQTKYLAEYEYGTQNSPFAHTVTERRFVEGSFGDTVKKLYKLIVRNTSTFKEKQDLYFIGTVPSIASRNVYSYGQNDVLLFDSIYKGSKCLTYYEFNYDGNNNCTKKIEFKRDNVSSPFDSSHIDIYEYDAFSRLVKRASYRKEDGLSNLFIYRFYLFSYSTMGNVSEESYYHRNNSNDPIKPISKYNCYYDNSKRLQSLVTRHYNGNSWWFSDSIAISYKNGSEYDSAYLYKGIKNINKWQWEKYSYKRYSFDKTSALSINELDHKLKSIKIYPNPTKDKLYIEAELKSSTEGLKIDIFNSLGQKVHSKNYHFNGINLNTIINTSHLPAGIYFLKIGGLTKKFVKE